MKKIFLVLIGVYYLFQSQAQTESTKTSKLNWTVETTYGFNTNLINNFSGNMTVNKLSNWSIKGGVFYHINENWKLKSTVGVLQTFVKQRMLINVGGYANYNTFKYNCRGLMLHFSADRVLIDKGESRLSLNFGFEPWSFFNDNRNSKGDLVRDYSDNLYNSSLTAKTYADLNLNLFVGLNVDFDFKRFTSGLSIHLKEQHSTGVSYTYFIEDFYEYSSSFGTSGYYLEIGTHFIF